MENVDKAFEKINKIALKLNIAMFLRSVHPVKEPDRKMKIIKHLQELCVKFNKSASEIKELFLEVLEENAEILKKKGLVK